MDEPIPDSPDEAPEVLEYATPRIPESLVRVRQYQSSVEANLARLALDGEGIRSNIAGDNFVGGMGLYGQGLGKIDLLVPTSDVEEAREILDAIDARQARRKAVEAAALQCPHCGETDSRGFGTGYVFVSIIILAVSATEISLSYPPIFGVIGICAGIYLLVASAWRRTCKKCGFNWQPPRPQDQPDDDEETMDET